MKEKNTFIFKGLISLVLSLILVFGTVATSLATVSENKSVGESAAAVPQWELPQLDDALSAAADVTAEYSESVPDSEQPTVYAAIAEGSLDAVPENDVDSADIAVKVEGSLDAVPADDEVLDIDVLSENDPQETPVLNRKANVDLAATGAAVTSGSLNTSKTYYLGADSDTYRLVYESGWKVKNSSNQYLTITSNYGSASINWTNNGTSLTASLANSSGITLSCTITVNYRDTTYYLTYSSGSFSANTAYSNYPRIAVYEAAVTYTVTFDKNDGSGTTSTQGNVPAHTATALTANSFTRDGYAFDGWNTAADGSGTAYSDGASVTLSANLTLYAQWTESATTPTESPSEIPTEAHTDANIVTIYFTNNHPNWNPNYWNNVYAYVWNSENEDVKNATFPGEPATYYGKNSQGQGLYSFAFDANKYDRLIFNDKETTPDQTTDIDVSDLISSGYNAVYFADATSAVTPYTYTYTSAPTVTEVEGGTIDSTGNYYIGDSSGLYVLEYVESSRKWRIRATTGDNKDKYWSYNAREVKVTWISNGGTELETGIFSTTHYPNDMQGWQVYFSQNSQTYYVFLDQTNNLVVQQNNQYRIAVFAVTGGGSGSGSGGSGGSGSSETYSFAVTQKLTTDSGSTWLTISDNTITQSQSSGITAGSDVVLTQTETDNYTFLGWYVDGIQVSTDSAVTFSNIRSNYPSVNTSNNNSNVLVVEARYEPSVQGSYIFKYTDRYGAEQKVTVPVTLNSSEINGYSGNNDQAGVPTFLWTDDAKTLFNGVNPLVKAALALEGNEETGGDNWQKDASVYKNDLVWNNLVATTKGDNITYDATAHTVTVTAATTPYTFTLMYYTVNGNTPTHQGTASSLVYGKAVTFNPIYSGSTEYAYVNYTVPSEGFSYWSADAAGAIPITTNLTYGMIMRGDYTDDGDNDRTVRIYAQYNKTISEAWKPLIEEVKLTRTIDDDHDWVYLDYMTNYLSQAGTVVQEMEEKPEYGIVVAKYDSAQTTLNQNQMQAVANAMITGNKSSAYLNSEKTAIAYRFNYSDNEHISDFNRVLYTLKSDTDKAENMQFTAIAYIVIDGTKYYSPINTDITVIDLV